LRISEPEESASGTSEGSWRTEGGNRAGLKRADKAGRSKPGSHNYEVGPDRAKRKPSY